MLVESLIKETVELQGFHVVAVQKTGQGLEANLVPDRRYAPRCGICGAPARYRDTRATRLACAAVGNQRTPGLCATQSGLRTLWRRPCRSDALGLGQAAIHSCADDHAGELGADSDLEAGGTAVSLFLEYGGGGGR